MFIHIMEVWKPFVRNIGAASWTDAAVILEIQGSAFYLHLLSAGWICTCSLPTFHCLISWVWHKTMLLNPEALFSILQQYANHSYFLLMFSIVSIILTDIFYEFSWTAFSHSNLYMLKLTHFRMWRQIQGLQIQIHWFLTLVLHGGQYLTSCPGNNTEWIGVCVSPEKVWIFMRRENTYLTPTRIQTSDH